MIQVRLYSALLAVVATTLTRASGMQAREGVPVTGTVAVASKKAAAPERSGVVVWLKSTDSAGSIERSGARARLKILQRNKRFEPRLLVVPVGTIIDFPNDDPFFHNVFSLFDGKRFDLGLYEAGTSRSVAFNRPGVCYIFCNIHPEMSAIVVTVDTPYFGVSSSTGDVTIADVVPGRYLLSAWHERHTPERPGEFPRVVLVTAVNRSLGIIRLVESTQAIVPHKNKYGQDYKPPRPTGPIYK